MKDLADLTLTDLQSSPIWEAIDQEFRIYRPRTKKGSAPLLSLVLTRFTAANGREYFGFGTVTKLALVSPTLFTENGQVPLHLGEVEPTREDILANYAALGQDREGLFPITFEIQAPVKYPPAWTTVEAFSYLSAAGAAQIL